MTRFFSRDIKKAIIDFMQDSVTGINKILGDIDIERQENLLTKAKFQRISSSVFESQFPEIFVRITQSNISDGNIDEDILNTEENYNVIITAQIKDNSDDIDDIIDNYEEGIKRCLHAKNISGLTYIYYESAQKTIPVESEGGIYMAIQVNFVCKVN